MKMSDDEEGIVYLQIEWHRREHYSGETAENENGEEAKHEKQRCLDVELAAPECRDPAEDLYAARNRDHHAGGREETLAHLRYRRGKHVVHPQSEADKASRDQRQYESRVAKDLAPRERDDDGRNKTERRNKDDVNLRMPEEPEEVLIKNR